MTFSGPSAWPFDIILVHLHGRLTYRIVPNRSAVPNRRAPPFFEGKIRANYFDMKVRANYFDMNLL